MKILTVKDHDASRSRLAEVLPLEAPLCVRFFISGVCNFRCFYCAHGAQEDAEKKFPDYNRMMTFDTFRSCVDNLLDSAPIKSVIFSGFGEPLLCRELDKMIAYARESGLTAHTELVTNGFSLTPAVSDRLISAGLNRIRVSLQGLDAAQYLETAGVKMDYGKFMDNLRYFYDHREQCAVYIKIMDEVVGDGKERFYEMFGRMADELTIEHLIPIDYIDLSHRTDGAYTKLGTPARKTGICVQPFYSMTIGTTGLVYPCCNTNELIEPLGDCTGDYRWNCTAQRDMLIHFLSGDKALYKACKTCTSYQYFVTEKDYIDDQAQELLARYRNQ